MRKIGDVENLRQSVFDKVISTLNALPPVENDKYQLRVSNIIFKPKRFTKEDEKKAILSKATLALPVRGKIELIDRASGKPVDSKVLTLMNIPYITSRGTTIVKGNEYTIANQARLLPGVYVRRKLNGEVEAHINPKDNTTALRVQFNPEKGVYYVRIGTMSLPLYNILHDMDVSDEEISKWWPKEILEANKTEAMKRHTSLEKFYNRLGIKGMDRKQKLESFFKALRLDPNVVRRNLKVHMDYVHPNVLLAASQRVMRVLNEEEEPDNRDAIQYQRVWGPEDLLAERIRKDAGKIRNNILWKSTFKNRLVLPNRPFDAYTESLLFSSGLAQPLVEISPLDIIDQQYRLTRLGEGGIESIDAIPTEARNVQPTYAGFIDSIRGPESFKLGVDMRFVHDVIKGDDNKVYRKLLNLKTGKIELVDNDKIPDIVIAFPNQKPEEGMIGALKYGKLELVNPNEAEYAFPSHHSLWSLSSLLVPFPEAEAGGRLLMAGKFFNQALPLAEPEEPLVQPADEDGRPVYRTRGDVGFNIYSPVSGTIKSISKNRIVIQDDAGKESVVDIYNNLPFNYRTFVHSKPVIKVGDKVKANQLIAHSNYTDEKGALAIGKNLKSVPPDSFVLWMENRQIRYGPIKDIPSGKRGIEAVSYSEIRDSILISPATKVFFHKLDMPVYEIILKSGRKLRVTGNHSIIVKTNGNLALMQASDLEVGMKLVRSYKMSKIWQACYGLGQEVEWSLGYLLSLFFMFSWKEDDVFYLPYHVYREIEDIFYDIKLIWKDAKVVILSNKLKIKSHGLSEFLKEYGYPDISSKLLRGSVLFIEGFLACLLDFKSKLKEGQIVVELPATEPDKLKVLGMMFNAKDLDYSYEEVGSNIIRIASYTALNVPWSKKDFRNNRRLKHEPEPEFNVIEDDIISIHQLSDDEIDFEFVYDIQMQEDLPNFYVEENILVHNTAYMSMKGLTYEDAVVVSESAAKKLASEMMVTPTLELHDKMRVGKAHYRALYPGKYTEEQLKNIDEGGVIKPSSIINPKDPLILAFAENDMPKVGTLFKGSKHLTLDKSVVWDKDEPGLVTDVVRDKDKILVAVKTYVPLKKGSKIEGRSGDKGVVAEIIPDDKMPRDEEGNPIDVILSPMGVLSRSNPNQIYEAILGKIAKKIGEPIVVDNFSYDDVHQFVKDMMRKHDVSDTEVLINPDIGKPYKNPVLTGYRYFIVPYFKAEEKIKARELGSYTQDMLPARGGKEGAKRISLMELNALLSHNATNFLRDAKLFRGQRNERFWNALKLGYALPTPEVPFIYKKFLSHLVGSGVRVSKQNDQLHIMALTDKDIDALAKDEIRNGQTVDPVDLRPIRGGLFDPILTGGHGGQQWTKISLAVPMPNPVMELPIRTLLDLTEKRFLDIIGGKEELNGKTGPEAIRDALSNIDVDRAIAEQKRILKGDKVSLKDKAKKKLGYLTTLKQKDIRPEELILTKFPVLPPIFRPISKTEQDVRIVADANYFYKTLIDLNDTIKKLQKEKIPVDEQALDLYKTLKATAGLADPIQPKLRNSNVKGLLKQIFGCFPPETEVFTRFGWRKIKDISILDSVLCFDPENGTLSFHEPFVVMQRRTSDISYEFEIADGNSLYVTENHTILTSKGPKPAKEAIKKKDHIYVAGLYENPNAHENETFLGFMLAYFFFFGKILDDNIHFDLGENNKTAYDELVNIISEFYGNDIDDIELVENANALAFLDHKLRDILTIFTASRLPVNERFLRLEPFLDLFSHRGIRAFLEKFMALQKIASQHKVLPSVQSKLYTLAALCRYGISKEKSAAPKRILGWKEHQTEIVYTISVPTGFLMIRQKGSITIVGNSSPKFGMFQRKILGTPVDLSALAHIIPNPTLSIDEVGLPEKAAWELYKPFIIRRMVKSGKSLTQAVREIENKTEYAKHLLEDEMSKRPIVINRAPTLHKFSMMGAWPKLVKDDDLHISPPVTKGFGADFDGDTMLFHVPVSQEAIEDVKRMMPSKNLFNPKDEGLVYVPTQDFVHGLYLASRVDERIRPIVFETLENALTAYRQGTIDYDTPIIIKRKS